MEKLVFFSYNINGDIMILNAFLDYFNEHLWINILIHQLQKK